MKLRTALAAAVLAAATACASRAGVEERQRGRAEARGRAFALYLESARHGEVAAIMSLARALGEIEARDEALAWYRKACDSGCAHALSEGAGVLLYQAYGERSRDDRLKAMAWMREAAATDPAAMAKLADGLQAGYRFAGEVQLWGCHPAPAPPKIPEEECAANRREAFHWRWRAATRGYSFVLEKVVDPVDEPRLALELYRNAARSGHRDLATLQALNTILWRHPELREIEDDEFHCPPGPPLDRYGLPRPPPRAPVQVPTRLARPFPPICDEPPVGFVVDLTHVWDEVERAGRDVNRLNALTAACFACDRWDDGRKIADRAFKLEISNLAARVRLCVYFYHRALEGQTIDRGCLDAGGSYLPSWRPQRECGFGKPPPRMDAPKPPEPPGRFAMLMTCGCRLAWGALAHGADTPDGADLALEATSAWRLAKRVRPSDPRPDAYARALESSFPSFAESFREAERWSPW